MSTGTGCAPPSTRRGIQQLLRVVTLARIVQRGVFALALLLMQPSTSAVRSSAGSRVARQMQDSGRHLLVRHFHAAPWVRRAAQGKRFHHIEATDAELGHLLADDAPSPAAQHHPGSRREVPIPGVHPSSKLQIIYVTRPTNSA